jgi:ABC-type lipoprotein export system ATPase subunit
MLQLNNICKSYTTGNFTQKALDNVSISFRDNEFVAILGPSGSGKTTMLNIVGGLDHYDSGDLVIEGISTKQYKDRDWDTYRNNRIGFVFQSYNLIPHQTVLSNVELALTLSGVSRDERRQRAIEALERVGLGDHIDKKPAQMSGGQMQRVAIARALINDPEILLADEPTGALDSKTSVQIMDLLTEIADDRLVVMVTHNPELAEQYATRIVNLADGQIRSDSDPYSPTEAEVAAANAKAPRRTRMSFLTALSLSFNNLMTKKGRTLMTAVAGSIGIIGIAAILALANGVNNYIKTVEEETLSVYPLQIMSTGFDFTTMFMGMGSGGDSGDDASISSTDGGQQAGDGSIGEARIISRMFASFGKNDLAALKEYLDSGESGIDQYVSSIYYKYAVTPQIFDSNTSEGVRQINPDTSFSAFGMGSGSYSNSLMSMSMSSDMFSEMSQSDIVVDQYDVVAGHWPEKENELVLVLTKSGRINDFLSYTLGLRDHDELDQMVKQFSEEKDIAVPDNEIDITYDDILGMKFKLVNATDLYRYDSEYGVWVDKSKDEEYMKGIVDAGEDLVITGIVQPKPESNATPLSMGIYYTPELTRHIVDVAKQSQIVKDQIADPKRDVFSGKTFDEMEEEGKEFDMESLFSIDEQALANAFTFDASAMSFSGFDPSSMNVPDLDLSGLSNMSMPQASAEEIAALFPELNAQSIMQGMTIKFTDDGAALQALMQKMAIWMASHPGSTANDYFNSDEGQQALGLVGASIDTQALQAELTQSIAQQLNTSPDSVGQVMGERIGAYYAAKIIPSMQQQLTVAIQNYMTAYITALSGQMSNMMAGLGNAIGFNADAFANAFQMNMSPDELTELMMSMMRVEEHSYDNNLKKLGYADFEKPSEISIYPKDFESKEHVIQILDDYNDRMRAEDEDKVISYTDIVGTLMESVTTIVNMISTVLIAFVAISLIVSSIMIGVITYISVLERKKEIGILRSIGASKGDISRVFNAETIIEGLIAGLLGVGVTAFACIPANLIVYSIFDVPNVALLPVDAAAILVAISVFLTFVAGLIPSKSASRKDPVEALRSE